MRRSFVCLLLLWHGASVVCAEQQQQQQQKVLDLQDDLVNSEIIAEQQAIEIRAPGADLVDDALTKLQGLGTPGYRRTRRLSGIPGTVYRWLFKLLPTIQTSAPSAPKKASTSGRLLEAVDLLEQAAHLNNSDALYLLASMNTFGNYSHPQDLSTAFRHYHKLAGLGNSTAQYMLGIFYATGVGNVVPSDQAKALLYYTYAAARGDTRAEMAVAFRHHAGVATPKNCDVAAKYYKRVADKAMKWYRSGPPGGMAWVQEAHRIADEHGGVYGEGASFVSAGMNAMKAGVNSDARASIDDVIEYYDLMSQKGDSSASYNLGRLYYDGQRGLERDLDLAKKYFLMVAKRYWKKDGRILENYKPGIEKIAAKAAGFLGRMYLRGEGVEQSFERAKWWFERGISHADAQSQYGMGLMLLRGYGGSGGSGNGGATRNINMATELFKASAEQDYHPAQVQLGVLYLDQGGAEDVRIANDYFQLAARYGNIEALYYLAEMIYHGVGWDRQCGMALGYYKNVAEKAEPLVSSWAEANLAYENGDRELAFFEYVMAAEQGYEKAQNNAAYMLDPAQSHLPPLQSLLGISLGGSVGGGGGGSASAAPSRSPLLDNPRLALMYWTRSSRQSNVDALVKMGDYYFYGVGADRDVHRAVACYAGASDYSQSAQALFNLGWMHENGVGLTQDFHLAKRYYDQALEVNDEAYLPVTLSLLKLRARSAWNTFTHGRVNSIQDDPKPKKDWSLGEWIANFLQDDGQYGYDPLYEDLYDEGGLPAPGGGADGDADAFRDADAVADALLILVLVAALVVLVWYRNHRQALARRHEEEERRRAQGLPPQQAPQLAQQPGANLGGDGPDFAAFAGGGLGL